MNGLTPRLVLWRHGRTAWNVEGRFQGQTDTELDEVGRVQARTAARRLAALRTAAVVSSDLRRARATAAELGRVTGLPVALDAGLREIHGGRWQGLTLAEIARRWPVEYAAWCRGEPVPRGGELEPEVAERFCASVARALQAVPADGVLVVVSHGSAIRSAIGRLLGLPPTYWRAPGPLSNCCWSVLGDGDGAGWRLLEHNAGSLPEPVLGEDR